MKGLEQDWNIIGVAHHEKLLSLLQYINGQTKTLFGLEHINCQTKTLIF